MRGFRMSAALAMAAATLGIGLFPQPMIAPPPTRINRRKAVATAYGGGRTKTTEHAPHGKRERARRLRQIERGQLRVENGLDPITV